MDLKLRPNPRREPDACGIIGAEILRAASLGRPGIDLEKLGN